MAQINDLYNVLYYEMIFVLHIVYSDEIRMKISEPILRTLVA